MTQELTLVGAGGFGRELLEYARDAGFRVVGYLDDSPTADLRDDRVPYLGGVADGMLPGGACVAIGLGDAAARALMAERLRGRGARLTTVVHPTAFVSATASLLEGCILAPFSMAGAHSRVGPNVLLNTFASVGHDAIVGAHSVLSPYASLTGAARVGAGVFMGSYAVAMPAVEVGAWAKIGAGSVAMRNVEPGALVVGSPAKGRVMFRPPPGVRADT